MLLTIVSSIFIVAFYDLTRHYVIIQPDNNTKISGEIFRKWSMFWEKEKKDRKLFYSGDALHFKLSELRRLIPNIGNKFTRKGIIQKEEVAFYVKEGQNISDEEIKNIESVLFCKIMTNGHYYFLYLEEPVYLFPAIIRKPMSACVRCMANPFGSSIWLSVNYLYNPFLWTNHKYFAFFFFWVLFLVVLSKINDYLYRKLY